MELHYIPMTDHLKQGKKSRAFEEDSAQRDHADRIPKGIKARMQDRRY